jgi:hypothetical protein
MYIAGEKLQCMKCIDTSANFLNMESLQPSVVEPHYLDAAVALTTAICCGSGSTTGSCLISFAVNGKKI